MIGRGWAEKKGRRRAEGGQREETVSKVAREKSWQWQGGEKTQQRSS